MPVSAETAAAVVMPKADAVPGMPAGRWNIPLVLAALYIVTILALGLVYHRIGDTQVETDFYWSYAPQAQHLLEGRLDVDEFKGPGYEVVLALMTLAVGDCFRAGLIISVLSAGAFLYMAYLLIEEITNRTAALFVMVAIAINTVFVHYSYTVSTDMFCSALLLAVTLYSLRARGSRPANAAIAGLLSGFAFITRYNAGAIWLGFFAVIWLLNIRSESIRRRIDISAVYTAAILVTVLPWSIYSHSVTGDFLHERNYLNVAYEMFGGNAGGWDRWWAVESHRYHSLYEVLAADPVVFTQKLLVNGFDHFEKGILLVPGYWIGACSVVGVAVQLFRRRSKEQAALLVFGLSYFVVLLPVFFRDRFVLFLLPIYIFAAVLLFQSPRIASLRVNRLPVGLTVLSVLLLAGLPRTFIYNRSAIIAGPEEVLRVADAFQGLHQPLKGGECVLARKPHIAYYLHMKFQLMPMVDSYPDLLQKCRELKVTYVFFTDVEAKLRPQLRGLLDPGNAPPGLRPVIYSNDPQAVLYKVEL